jgi:hypothetical protein
VVWGIQVGAGVADHRDEIHRELGAGRIDRRRLVTSEMRRDYRCRQAGIGDHAGAYDMVQLDEDM